MEQNMNNIDTNNDSQSSEVTPNNSKNGDQQRIKKILKPYARSNDRSAWIQMANTFLPFFCLLFLASYAITSGASYAWLIVTDLTLGLLIVRMYVLQHDCGHSSLFATKKWNTLFGNLFSIFTLTPLSNWRNQHSLHHSTVCNLEKDREGYFWVMTTDEYNNCSPLERIHYKLYKNPLIQFGIGTWLYFIIVRRIPFDLKKPFQEKYRDTHWTNLGMLTVYPILYYFLGLETMLWVVLPSILISITITVWGFYVQHFFPGAYWGSDPDWSVYNACTKGSSYLDLPKILLWFSADISVHHIHHFNPRIPNYNLQKCMRENGELKPENPIGLFESLSYYQLKLWNQEQQSFVPFP